MHTMKRWPIILIVLTPLVFCDKRKHLALQVMDVRSKIAQPGLSTGNVTDFSKNDSSAATTTQDNQQNKQQQQKQQHPQQKQQQQKQHPQQQQTLWLVGGPRQDQMLSPDQASLANFAIAVARQAGLPALLTLLVPLLLSLLGPLIANIANAFVATAANKRLLSIRIPIAQRMSIDSILHNRRILAPLGFDSRTNRF